MNLTLRRATKAEVITAEQHDTVMAMAPTVERNGQPTPEAAMVLSLYQELGGCPVSMGMAGAIDRRADVHLSRLAVARDRHPTIDPEFFEGLFGFLDSHYVAEMSRRAEAAMERAKGG